MLYDNGNGHHKQTGKRTQYFGLYQKADTGRHKEKPRRLRRGFSTKGGSKKQENQSNECL